MKFFIDTANLAQIREANEMGVLDGVTTNPSLMAKENIRGEEACRRHYLEICSIVDGDVSAEVIATDFDGMVREGEALAALHKNIVVKLPCTADGIRAVKYFAGKNIRTNCTLVFSANQALLAARAGATYVSPFLGRLDDIGQPGIELIETIHDMFLNYPDIDTQIIAASVRNPIHVTDCALAGADIATVPYKVIEQMLHHPLTDAGIEKFKADYIKVFGE
jgi:transaldolase